MEYFTAFLMNLIICGSQSDKLEGEDGFKLYGHYSNDSN